MRSLGLLQLKCECSCKDSGKETCVTAYECAKFSLSFSNYPSQSFADILIKNGRDLMKGSIRTG